MDKVKMGISSTHGGTVKAVLVMLSPEAFEMVKGSIDVELVCVSRIQYV